MIQARRDWCVHRMGTSRRFPRWCELAENLVLLQLSRMRVYRSPSPR